MSVDRYRPQRPPIRPRPPRVESSDEFLARHGLLDEPGSPAGRPGFPAGALPPPPGGRPPARPAPPGQPTTHRDERSWSAEFRQRPPEPGGQRRRTDPQAYGPPNAPSRELPMPGRPPSRTADGRRSNGSGDSGRFTSRSPGRRGPDDGPGRAPGYGSRPATEPRPGTGRRRAPEPGPSTDQEWPTANGGPRTNGRGRAPTDPVRGPARRLDDPPAGGRRRSGPEAGPPRRANGLPANGHGAPPPRVDLPADGHRSSAPVNRNPVLDGRPPAFVAGPDRARQRPDDLLSPREAPPSSRDDALPGRGEPAVPRGRPSPQATDDDPPAPRSGRRRGPDDEPGRAQTDPRTTGDPDPADDAPGAPDDAAGPVADEPASTGRRGRGRKDPGSRAVGTSGTGRSVARARAEARTAKVRARADEPAADDDLAVEAKTAATAARTTDSRTAGTVARNGASRTGRTRRPGTEPDDASDERLRVDRIDETLTRLTAAHAGLVLGRRDADDEDDEVVPPRRRARPAVRVGRAAVAAVALLLVLVAGLGWVGRTRLDGALTQVAAVDVAPDGVVDATAQTGAENVLVLAVDTGGSAGATTRANTATVVHRDARGDRTVAVTLPPRLEITRPPCERWDPAAAAYLGQTVPAEPRTTLGSAYAVGGPRCATRTAQQVTGLAITRFVAVDLAATSSLVEAVGGVQVCVERPVLDSVLGPIAATAGTDGFNGARAATLVRAADVRGEPAGGAALVQRQQRVLAAALGQALSPTTLLHPGRVGRLLPALGTAVVSIGTGVADLLALANATGEVRAVPTEPQANSRGNLELRETDAQALFAAVRTGAALPAPAEPAAASAPADVTADVLNASGRDGLAAEVAGTLGDLGFRTAEVRNAEQPALGTVVRYSPDRSEQAQLLAAAVPSATAVPDPGTTGVLQLVLGRSFDGTVRAGTAAEPAAEAPVAPAATCG